MAYHEAGGSRKGVAADAKASPKTAADRAIDASHRAHDFTQEAMAMGARCNYYPNAPPHKGWCRPGAAQPGVAKKLEDAADALREAASEEVIASDYTFSIKYADYMLGAAGRLRAAAYHAAADEGNITESLRLLTKAHLFYETLGQELRDTVDSDNKRQRDRMDPVVKEILSDKSAQAWHAVSLMLNEVGEFGAKEYKKLAADALLRRPTERRSSGLPIPWLPPPDLDHPL